MRLFYVIMACDCRTKLEKELRENLGDPLAKLNGVFHFVGSQLQFAPTVEVIYRKKKKDGSFCKKESTMQLSYPFCPFCGKPFDDSAESKI